jgi:SET domain
MYTGVPLKEGQNILPVDVMVANVDTERHRTFIDHYNRLANILGSHIAGKHGGFPPPRKPALAAKSLDDWLMKQYYWDCAMTHNYYDAEKIDSVIPGLGMLANSHPGMILAYNTGPKRPPVIGGRGNGARSPYQDQVFVAEADIPAAHELFVEYGDSWFEDRFHESFGLSDDYAAGNALAEKWQINILDKNWHTAENSSVWSDLQGLVLDSIKPFDVKLHEVLSRVDLAHTKGGPIKRFLAKDNPASYASVPNAPRTIEWLQNEGLCLDHITIGESLVAPRERGAFASRFLPKGIVVTPAPVVHMSRDHLTMVIMDNHDSDIVLWKGYQLLLNYVYGHEESSLVFFPYAPAVNLINHYAVRGVSGAQEAFRPNVKLQWSSRMAHPEWLEWTPDQVLAENLKSGLFMEIVALEDIAPGEEIVLDYGDAWQAAFDEHARTTPPPPELQSVDWNQTGLLTINDKEKYPSFVDTVCWIDRTQEPLHLFNRAKKEWGGKIPKQWLPWKPVKAHFLSDTMSCTVVGKITDGASYNVIVKDTIEQEDGTETDVEVRITNIPRSHISIVPLEYVNAELRRDSFRKEIQLPDEMVPENWRDLKPVTADKVLAQCNLYMAESAVPNAGWGIYRGYALPLQPNRTNELDHFCEDMVIQVEDFDLNQELRNRYFKQPGDPELDSWLLSQFAWTGDLTKGGNLEAARVDSFSPGCGMLANAYPVLYNSHPMPPMRIPISTTDPSLGATTHYHNGLFVEQYLKFGQGKVRMLKNGSEILVKASDEWLEAHEPDVGKLPSRLNFIAMDKVLKSFFKLRETHSKGATDLVWKLLWNTVQAFHLDRISTVLPLSADDVKAVVEGGGAARHQLKNLIRTPDWLENHGSCVDNIRPGPSTIEMAGNGAFAARALAQGSVIAPLPLIHLHRHHMDVFHSNNIRDPNVEVWPEGQQLILNYCFGHPESNLLLFPYSPVVNYINHASGGKANAKLQWSSQFNKADWLQKSPEDLLRHHKTTGLAFDLVATRDIAPGEEVTIDYGTEWESAWQEHRENWRIASDWNYEPPQNDWLDWMPTEEEIEKRSLVFQFDRPDKFLGCHVKLPDVPIPRVIDPEAPLPEYEWQHVDGMFRTTTHVFPCEITERSLELDNFLYSLIRKDSVAPLPETYTAVITVHPGTLTTPPRQFISFNMPRRAIEIFDEEYSSPQFYRGAFRHAIGIPDDLIPDTWRDLKA